MDPVTIGLGDNEFTKGLFYVALSRVINANNLIIEPFSWNRYI